MQRKVARDFYDIWYLLEIHGMNPNLYVNEFAAKCKSKGLDHVDFFKKLEERMPQYKGRWENSLKEQIKDLPDFETIKCETERNLKKFKQ